MSLDVSIYCHCKHDSEENNPQNESIGMTEGGGGAKSLSSQLI